MRVCLWGALVITVAPLFSQSQLSGIQLQESPMEIRRLLGEPVLVADVNSEFRSWQYRLGGMDHEDFSHALIFRKSTNTLVSVSRTFETPVNIEKLFPPSASTYFHFLERGKPEMVVRVHRLANGRLLLAFGSAKPDDLTNQIVLIEGSALRVFYPWLAEQLK